MKIGLYNLEPHIVNSAMMRVSSFYKTEHDVELYRPLFHNTYDVIYAFSIFDFTPKNKVRSDMICGGSGFDTKIKLLPSIEEADYDWSLYPNCDFSILWYSTGCIRKCPFCIVPEKEGKIKPVSPHNLNPNGTFIKVMDNNFFANPKWQEAIVDLKVKNQPVDFQGVDVRIIKEEHCKALNSLRHEKQIKIAWDNPRDNLVDRLKLMVEIIPPRKLLCYVLIGYWSTPEEDLYRVETLRNLKINPFVMPFDKFDPYQRRFARWVNHKAIFHSVKWKEYRG